MISTFRLGLIFSFNFILLYGLFGQATTISFSERLREIRERSSQHENQVASLLAQPSIKPVDYNNISPPLSPPPPAPAPSSVPSADGDGSAVPVNQVPKENMIVEPVESDSVKLVEVTESNSTSTKPNEELDDAYAKLYEPDIPSRLQGYYFGPLLGLVFPQDGAIRSGNPMISEDYEADSGFLLGLQAGKDFGSVRVEAEYTYHNFDASSPTFSLSASIHNFFGRLILEKEIGDRFDLRFGLGMGMGIVGMETSSVASTDDYSGTGFAYDFLLGTSYRLSDNWSLQADYRYYLTAAHDNYDHVKSHLWLIIS